MRLFRRLTKREWKEIGEKYKDGGVHMYRGKRTLFYNGEELWEGNAFTGDPLIYNTEERQSWEVIIVLPGVEIIPTSTFYECKNIKTVIMADTVKRIEDHAFFDCWKLIFVKLSRNLEYIGKWAFAGCDSLTSIFIPPSCREIDDRAFQSCQKLIILQVPQQTQLGDDVIHKTALIRESPFEIEEYYEYNNNDDINEWIKKDHHEDFPLHKICCSENPTFKKEYPAEDWTKEDDCKLTPLHYLSSNPHVNIGFIQNIIQQNQSAFLGSNEQAKLGESLLFEIAAFLPIRFSALQCFIKMYPKLREVRNGEGQTLQEVREQKYDPPTKTLKSFGKNDVGLNDNPKKTPDRLGYSIYAEGISKIAQDAEKSGTYFCVGLLGPWGSGKTKLWNLIKENLESSTEGGKVEVEERDVEEGEEENNQDDQEKLEKEQNKAEVAPGEQNITCFGSYIAFLEKYCCLREVHEKSVGASRKYENEMRNETIAMIVILSPFVLIALPFLVLSKRCCRKDKDRVMNQSSLDLKLHQANTIADLILGQKELYYSFAKTRPFTFKILLRRFILVPVRFFCRFSQMFVGSFTAMVNLKICRSQSLRRTEEACEKPKYIFAEFNAWTYNGSDNLWASLVEQLYTVVEEEFSPLEVRSHRASIDLLKKYSKDNDNDEEEGVDKEEERAGALFRFYMWTIMSFALAIIGVAIGIWLFQDSRNEDNGSDVEARPRGTYFIGQIGGITFLTMSPIPLLKQLFIFLKDILPILRQGHRQLIQSAIFGKRFRRRDFSQEMGFMSEVKTEIEYLFDFLQVKRKHDEATNKTHPVRLCIFVDDLDRCNSKTVVSVLEAVFLLLSESPITCYLAIDTRLVVASIDEHYTVHDRAGINGYDFLEKIIQLPFCVPDLTDSKKQAFINRLFLSGQLDPVQLCSTITKLKTNHNLYPDTDRFGEVPQGLNKDNALIHLAQEYAKFHRAQLQVPLGVEHRNFLLEHDLVDKPDCIGELSKAQKESFLYHAAYYLQQVQETVHNENMDDEEENEESTEFQRTQGNIEDVDGEDDIEVHESNEEDDIEVHESNEEDDIEVHESNEEDDIEVHESNEEDDIEVHEEDDIEVHEIDFVKEFPWVTKEVKTAVPLSSMMTPQEREWFTDYASYISGKPRCITRVVNCYNLARYVAEKVTPEAIYKNAITPKRKLMKLIILSEFWPYRTAFLMQVAEDIMQLNVSLLCLYNRVVEPLLHSTSNPREAEKMLARDGDPQLFEHLLSSVSDIDDVKSDLLKVKDIVVPFNNVHVEKIDESIHLRYFVLNMSRHMLEYCARCLDNLILYSEERYSFVDKCKREVLMYKHKHKYFTSGETPIDTTNKTEETKPESNSSSKEDHPQNDPLSSNEVIFIRVQNAKGEIEDVIKCQMDEEITLAEHLEKSTKCTRSVHIDDDLFI
ncbi:hypothetical protein CTEN210_13558 [Chaetoceros tenuissimus]|uniref:KAP NTPase domain-containing protein n=1 Tax=Chaetoceros tenuissimus TaxID=426638 RepID=A0AAD3D3Z5_9STRA|nr:hypothetical protein CTEN210_13558 [Chaetoceros tenuissimus]